MISVPSTIVFGDFEDCLRRIEADVSAGETRF
jgi:hypothetical protein